MSVALSSLSPGDIVVIAAFDDIPQHRFRVDYVFEDCIGGYSLDGPLAGDYGEPDSEMILQVLPPDQPLRDQHNP